MARLIALYSTVPQSGKTTAANHLVDAHGFQRVKFAGTLKSMVYTFLRGFRDDPDWAYACIEGDLKEEPIAFLGGKTPRDLMVTLGTDWGRNLVNQAVWVTATIATAKRHLEAGQDVVIDDMRFPNEYLALRHYGADFIKVQRLGVTGVGSAQTEGLLEACSMDWHIAAWDGDLEAIHDALDGFLTP